ncbi:MAG: monovalent cation/H+ antiporter complex subunit F [Pirellulaceae bacterium]|nr:monovalent cation/H+ antiporter complex subunit F [Pirellulaceae bacterium]
MNVLILGVAFFLLVNVVAGLVRVWRGPTALDRMLASQLFGTTGTAILLLLAEGLSNPALRDVALVFALLAPIATVVFVRRWPLSSSANGGSFHEHE